MKEEEKTYKVVKLRFVTKKEKKEKGKRHLVLPVCIFIVALIHVDSRLFTPTHAISRLFTLNHVYSHSPIHINSRLFKLTHVYSLLLTLFLIYSRWITFTHARSHKLTLTNTSLLTPVHIYSDWRKFTLARLFTPAFIQTHQYLPTLHAFLGSSTLAHTYTSFCSHARSP